MMMVVVEARELLRVVVVVDPRIATRQDEQQLGAATDDSGRGKREKRESTKGIRKGRGLVMEC